MLSWRWWIIALTVLALGCKRPSAVATSKPTAAGATGDAPAAGAVAVTRKYEPIGGHTFVRSSAVNHQVGGRRVRVSGAFDYEGREPSRFIEGVTLQLVVRTGGPLVEDEKVPYELKADGARLPGTTKAVASTLNGVRVYSILMSAEAMRRLAKAESITLSVEDLSFPLSADDRRALAKLVEAMEDWRKPAVEGAGRP